MERTGPPDDEIFHHFWRIASQGWPLIEIPYMRCDMAHNKAAIAMLKHNAQHLLDGKPENTFTHMLSMDIDHRHPSYIVRRFGKLVQENPTRLVLGGLNYRRGEPWEPCAYVKEDGSRYSFGNWAPGVAKVDELGLGSMLIATEVFERFWKAGDYPWFGYDYKLPAAFNVAEASLDDLDSLKYPGVDIYFCDLCQKHGIDIWVDTLTTSPHLSKLWIDRKMWEGYQETPAFKWKYQAYGDRLAQLRGCVPEIWDGPWQRDGVRSNLFYVGANKKRAHYAQELKEAGYWLSLLEVNESNANYHEAGGLFDEVWTGDIRDYSAPPGWWHVAFWWHGPEHVTHDDLDKALGNLEGTVKEGGLIVLGCPWGEAEQEPLLGNPNEEHVGTYYPEDFEKRGYKTATLGEKDTGHGSILSWKFLSKHVG